jgi:hypothetical protein
MSKARELQRHQAYTLQNCHFWGLPNVMHTTLTVADCPSVQEFNKRWASFAARVLSPATDGRWIRFLELQRRGSPHAHVLHYWEGAREGCEYATDEREEGVRGHWIEKGEAWRECVRVMDRCQFSQKKGQRGFGFGWNQSEPLRGTEESDLCGMVRYLLGYASKSRYVGRDEALAGARLVSNGQGCIERHGCKFDYRNPPSHPNWCVKSSPAQYEVIEESLDRDKREMIRVFCEDVGIGQENIGPYSEGMYPQLPPSLAVKTLWQERIIPLWRKYREFCEEQPF